MRLLIGVALGIVVLAIAAGITFWGPGSSTLPQPVPEQAAGAAPPAPGAPPEQAQPAAAAAPAAQGASPPTVVKRETYGDWLYACVDNPATKTVLCAISQEISEIKTKQMVFLWRIAQNGKGGLTATWQTPEGMQLRAGIMLDAGTPKPIQIPYEICASRRCQATANLAADFQDTLSKATKAAATIVLASGKSVTIPLSVKGLADGLAALKQPAPPPG